MTSPLYAAVLAAGEGTRLGGAKPKVLTPLWGLPAICWPVNAIFGLEPARLDVVVGADSGGIRESVANFALDSSIQVEFAVQSEPRGTGHAVLAAKDAWTEAGSLLVMYGDCPLTSTGLLSALVAHHREVEAELTVLTTVLDDPTGYGRIVRGEEGHLAAIVEEVDADEIIRGVEEVNTGIYVMEVPAVLEDLATVEAGNAQGEIYLTDLVSALCARGAKVSSFQVDDWTKVLGFNNQTELAVARALLRKEILAEHLEAGVEIVDPNSTFIDKTVTLEPGACILPGTVIEGPGTVVGAGCVVGPMAHLRAGTHLEPGSKVGNFTETKQTHLGAGAKANHLSYLGDAEVGPGSNIGAGTITANYDGKDKHRTVIGKDAFVGSGTVIVAPASVGDGSTTGAGAIVTRESEVPDGDTWVGVPARPLKKATPPSEDDA